MCRFAAGECGATLFGLNLRVVGAARRPRAIRRRAQTAESSSHCSRREYGLICRSLPCSLRSCCVTGRPSLHGHCSSPRPHGPGRRVASDVRSAAGHGGAGIGGDDDGAARPREITSSSGAATRDSHGPNRQPPNVVIRSSIDSDERTRVQDPRITSLSYKRWAIRSRSRQLGPRRFPPARYAQERAEGPAADLIRGERSKIGSRK